MALNQLHEKLLFLKGKVNLYKINFIGTSAEEYLDKDVMCGPGIPLQALVSVLAVSHLNQLPTNVGKSLEDGPSA